jgi:hypothetical protein
MCPAGHDEPVTPTSPPLDRTRLSRACADGHHDRCPGHVYVWPPAEEQWTPCVCPHHAATDGVDKAAKGVYRGERWRRESDPRRPGAMMKATITFEVRLDPDPGVKPEDVAQQLHDDVAAALANGSLGDVIAEAAGTVSYRPPKGTR